MTGNKLTELSLFFLALLSGFYGGIGFFVAIGGNPAIKLMSDRTFAEYWQHADHFMAERMRIFGPLLLLTTIVVLILLIKERSIASTWCIAIALVLLVTDVAFTMSTNHPLNQLIQSWDLNHLPSNVQEIKFRVVKAFNVRIFLMMSSFFFVLLAVFLNKKS